MQRFRRVIDLLYFVWYLYTDKRCKYSRDRDRYELVWNCLRIWTQ